MKSAKYQMLRNTNNAQNIVMSGVDLVEPIPIYSSTQAGSNAIFFTIPANPLYWRGTRIAAQASAYQQYRPLKFDVKYVPSVPVTVPGQVVYGTLWNVGTNLGAFQQSLVTSNGGGITTCYQSAWSRVRCNDNYLPLRFYNVGDNMTENTTCPFTWVAYYTGESSGMSSGPGYVILHWKYEFTVGIGQSARYALTYSSQDQQELESMSNDLKLNVPWGVALGILKQGAITVLRSVAIFLLDSVLAQLKNPSSNDGPSDVVRVPKGTILDYDLVNIQDSVAGYSILKQNGTTYYVPDSAPCVIWQTGNEVVKSAVQPPIDTPSVSDIIVDWKEASSIIRSNWSETHYNHYTKSDEYAFKFVADNDNTRFIEVVITQFRDNVRTTVDIRGSGWSHQSLDDSDNVTMKASWGDWKWTHPVNSSGWNVPDCYDGPHFNIDQLLAKYPVK